MSDNWKRPHNMNYNWKRQNNKDGNWKRQHNREENWKRPHNREENWKRRHNRNENWKHPHDSNTNAQSEKPFNNAPRHTLNFWRRPSFPSRRRGGLMAGRYPNMGFRQHPSATYRPDCPTLQGNSPGFRYPTPNPPTGISAPFAQRPPFLRMPSSTLDNKNNQCMSSATNINESQVATEFKEQSSDSNDLWVESLAPGGRIYFYNTRTRESTWRKPINVRIIELNEIKELTDIEKPDKIHQGNSNQSMQQQSINNPNVNAFYPKAFSMSPPRIMFPPNVFTPPPNFLRPPAGNIQSNVANYNFGLVMSRTVLPIPVVTNDVMNEYTVSAARNLLPTNNIVEYNSNVPQNLLPSDNMVEYNSNAPQNLLPSDNMVEYNSNAPQNLLPSDNMVEYNSNVPQNLLPSDNMVEYNSNASQNLLPSDSMGEYNSNVPQNLLPSDNMVEYNSNVPQNLLPSDNMVEYNSNAPQNLLPSDNMVEYNSNAPQNLLPSDNMVEYNSNVPQNLLPSDNTVEYNSNIPQNLLPSDNIVECNSNVQKNAMQNCLSRDKMNDGSATATQNLISKAKVIDYSSSDSDETDAESSINKDITRVKSKNDNPSINTSVSNITPSSNVEVTTKNANENSEQEENEKSVDLKSKNVSQSTKSEDSVIAETKDKSPAKPLNKDKPVNKSRPVSSTPVSGTSWSVVWTGDEKVFFFDNKRKVSIWERPGELLDRSDVDKMVKKSPLSLHLKPLTKEARKNISDEHLDVTKKQKIDDEKTENSESKKTVENSNIESIVVDENTLGVEEKSKVDAYSHNQRIEKFCEMLSDHKVSIFSTWEKEVHKTVFDSRYLLLPADERKKIFNDYIERKSLEEIDRRQKDQLKKDEFLSMLMETGVTSESLFCDIAHRCSEDARFKAIEELQLKESIFNQYVSELKQKDEDREKLENKMKSDFVELLSEKSCFDKEWSKAQGILEDDERYKAIECDSLKEDLFKEYVQEKHLNISLVEKREDSDDCLKDREKEVKRDLPIRQKNREKGEKYRLAVSNFKAMLEDLIADSIISWQSARTILKADQRWNYSECLGTDKCEKLFQQHTHAKKRDQFRCLLNELPDVTIKTSWLDIRKDVLKDPRCARFSPCERKCEKEFKEYLNSKRARAKVEFYQLLKETKLITHKSQSLLNSSDHLKDIEKALSEDKRYLDLDCMRSDRKKMILSYIEKLRAKGSPLPPTANDRQKRI